MENNSEIPMFKRSKDSLSRDVLKLKKLEAISEGWYKGQLVSLLDKVAKRVVINGVECFNTNIVIDSYTSENDNSEYAKNIKKLLELLGISKETLTKIYNTSTSDQVNGIRLNFNKNSSKNREFTEFDFKQTFISLKKQIENADRFELIHTNKYYELTDVERPAIKSNVLYTGSIWKKDDDFFDELQEYIQICDESACTDYPVEIKRTFEVEQSMHYSEVKIYDEYGLEITLNYPELLVNALKVCLMFSGDRFAELESVEKISEELYNSEVLERNIYVVKTLEKYNNVINMDFLEDYENYKNGTLQIEKIISSSSDGNGDSYEINGIIAMHYWSYFLILDSLDNDITNDLFYIDKKPYTFAGKTYYSYNSITRYINVAGIKRANAKIIASSFSQYADFQILQAKKKTRFLGIGGFIGSFLGGIFNIIMQGIQLIAKVLYYIPLVRLEIQFVAWVFSGKWSNDRDRFVMAASRIVLAIIALAITVSTGGGGFQIALSLLMSAYGLYNGLKEFDEIKEFTENQARYNSTEEATNKLNEKLIDLSNERDGFEAKNNALYKPFETLNNIYKSPFEKGGLYNPKFG